MQLRSSLSLVLTMLLIVLLNYLNARLAHVLTALIFVSVYSVFSRLIFFIL